MTGYDESMQPPEDETEAGAWQDDTSPIEEPPSQALAVIDHNTAAVAQVGPITIDALVERMDLVKQATARVMVEGQHYGQIPGTSGDKKSLLKGGAETLSLLFRLRPRFTVSITDIDTTIPGHREYSITCDLYAADGTHEGQGVGSCSTMESKYRWRTGKRLCPKCGAEAIIKGKEEYGGGWLCWKKNDGCGAKFTDTDIAITGQSCEREENEDPADLWNTCLKIGKKRAMVDAVLTATAASDQFTQDVEDMPSMAKAPPAPAPAQQRAPVRNPTPATATAQLNPEQITRYQNSVADLTFELAQTDLDAVLEGLGTTMEQILSITGSENARKMYGKIEAAMQIAPPGGELPPEPAEPPVDDADRLQ